MNILELKNVAYQVKDKQILANVSFTVEQGDFLTLVGPSGAGKSTILKLIASLISPTGGEIIYQGKNIKDLNPINYRREVSYCFQEASLFGKTVRDNLAFPYEIRKQSVDEQHLSSLLKKVDLSDDFLDKEITSLSGGEKQRVGLLRNIVFLPKVILLDEVTTGLDDASKQIVHDLIASLRKQGITLMQVTHDQSEIQAASHILHVNKGGFIK